MRGTAPTNTPPATPTPASPGPSSTPQPLSLCDDSCVSDADCTTGYCYPGTMTCRDDDCPTDSICDCIYRPLAPFSCDHSCLYGGNECITGLICIHGEDTGIPYGYNRDRCRNPDCPTDWQCCPGPTSTPAPCNHSCDTRSDCVSGYCSLGNKCRNENCVAETDCMCGTAPVPTSTPWPVSTDTPTPTRTPTPRPTNTSTPGMPTYSSTPTNTLMPTNTLIPTLTPTPVSGLTGLIWYSKLENEASVTNPYIGTGGTVRGATFVAGKYGNGALFGANAESIRFYVTGANSANFNKAKGAIEFWFQPTWDYDDGVAHYLFTNYEDENNEFKAFKWTDNYLKFSIKSNGTRIGYSIAPDNYSWSAGEWVHLRFEWDDSVSTTNQQKIFINGVEPVHIDDTDDYNSTNLTLDQYMYLSCNCSDETGGVIDEFKVFGGSVLTNTPVPTSSSIPTNTPRSTNTPRPTTTTTTPVCLTCSGVAYGKHQGNADCNGVIDMVDFTIWYRERYLDDDRGNFKNNWLSDFNCNGYVDISDLTSWINACYETGMGCVLD